MIIQCIAVDTQSIVFVQIGMTVTQCLASTEPAMMVKATTTALASLVTKGITVKLVTLHLCVNK